MAASQNICLQKVHYLVHEKMYDEEQTKLLRIYEGRGKEQMRSNWRFYTKDD